MTRRQVQNNLTVNIQTLLSNTKPIGEDPQYIPAQRVSLAEHAQKQTKHQTSTDETNLIFNKINIIQHSTTLIVSTPENIEHIYTY